MVVVDIQDVGDTRGMINISVVIEEFGMPKPISKNEQSDRQGTD